MRSYCSANRNRTGGHRVTSLRNSRRNRAQVLGALLVRRGVGRLMHPTKTKIVYCKDGKRKGTYPNVTFDFLGYQFRPRMVRSSRNGQLFYSFTPAVSPTSLKAIRSTVRDLNIPQLTVRSSDDIARMLNPLLRGWIQYYGRYNSAALEIMLRYVNLTVLRWVMRKFKRFQGRKVGAANFLEKLVRIQPSLFEHWRIRMIGAFA